MRLVLLARNESEARFFLFTALRKESKITFFEAILNMNEIHSNLGDLFNGIYEEETALLNLERERAFDRK